jgi:hypothetical protein
LEEELGPLPDKHRQLVKVLGLLEPARPMLPHEANRFRLRTTVERVNARLKDEFGGRNVRVRGALKVMARLMFGILALSADQILRQSP